MITIETVKYFGDNGQAHNAIVSYRKQGKLRLCRVYIDFFNERVYIPKQGKSTKALAGFEKAINDFAVKSNFLFN